MRKTSYFMTFIVMVKKTVQSSAIIKNGKTHALVIAAVTRPIALVE